MKALIFTAISAVTLSSALSLPATALTIHSNMSQKATVAASTIAQANSQQNPYETERQQTLQEIDQMFQKERQEMISDLNQRLDRMHQEMVQLVDERFDRARAQNLNGH